MNRRRTQHWLAVIFLTACQSDQFIPVKLPASQTRAFPTATRQISTPIEIDPTPSQWMAEPTAKPATPQSTSTLVVAADDDCIKASFISDVSIPDGTILMAEEIFLKIWRLKNSGDCVWPDDLWLVFIAGDPMGGGSEVQAHYYPEGLPLIASLGERAWAESRQVVVPPEDVIDVPVFFQAPGIAGDYFSLWALRASRSSDDLIQIYLEIRVEGPETPEPTTWGGLWQQLNLHADENALSLSVEQRDVQVRGFFYTADGELYLLEGGLFDQGSRVEGTFGPPYHDGFPFTWQQTPDGQKFQGFYRDRFESAGAWCGARSDELPDPCTLEPEG